MPRASNAYLEYKEQKLNEERLHTRGQNDFELVKKVLRGFDVDLIDTSKEEFYPVHVNEIITLYFRILLQKEFFL